MSLLEKIDQDLLEAIKKSDHFRRDTLRFLKSNLANLRISLQADKLTEDQIVLHIQKEIKQRKEAAEALNLAKAIDRAKKELEEIALLEIYLPKQLSESEIVKSIEEYLAQNPTTIKEMGKVMKELGEKLRGRADMSLVAQKVRQLLS